MRVELIFDIDHDRGGLNWRNWREMRGMRTCEPACEPPNWNLRTCGPADLRTAVRTAGTAGERCQIARAAAFDPGPRRWRCPGHHVVLTLF